MDNEISPAIVKSAGLDNSLQVPANLDDTLITPCAAVSSLHHDTAGLPSAACPQVLADCSLFKQTARCLENISSSVFIQAESVFLVRRVPGEGKCLGQQIQSVNPNPHYLNLEENDFLQLPSLFRLGTIKKSELSLLSAFQTYAKLVSLIMRKMGLFVNTAQKI